MDGSTSMYSSQTKFVSFDPPTPILECLVPMAVGVLVVPFPNTIIPPVNLFYKPWLYDVKSKLPSLFTGSWVSSISRSTCPLYGFKCPTDEPCDCSQMCSNGDFVPFQVLPKDKIFLMDQHLTPGMYCLPRGIGNCNQKTSYHVFSLTGWKCIPRHQTLYQEQTLVACHHEEAEDNSKKCIVGLFASKTCHGGGQPLRNIGGWENIKISMPM
ncbi:uncharacterized protein TNCT_623511 [Trichonephila clavata]|uniref:Uncharacterized protein n=1 Tax=Trichonephila clavata TaxID=2740835 RepID=A0A8X6GIC0_TRICU|nr:uncharacterized protein TNCT_623511 [Trichonephila clavata]